MLKHSLTFASRRSIAASRSTLISTRGYRRLRAAAGSTADARDAALLKVFFPPNILLHHCYADLDDRN